jgi:photoactive yellow protein
MAQTTDSGIDVHDPRVLDHLTETQLDALPVGAIRVDGEGRILFYSRGQSALSKRAPGAVLGRNFFSEIAPCTVVPEFYGRFRRGVLTGQLDVAFEFVFDFGMEPVQVGITMHASERLGEFWILVRSLRQLPTRDVRAAKALIAGKFCASLAGLSAASFDFAQCDQEPIATCGAIQPFGALLVLDAKQDRIDACSANTAMILGLAPEQVLDRSLAEVLPALDLSDDAPWSGPLARRHFHFPRPDSSTAWLCARLHHWRARRLLEIEAAAEPGVEMAMDARLRSFDLGAFQTLIHRNPDRGAICQAAAEAFRRLSDFERVLVYRFDPDHTGVVVGESLAPGAWPPVLGLRYPATDIPRQARALYCETPLRYAPSRDHPQVRLLSRRLSPGEIDIGIAQVRAQSPIHRNYLQRFGVNGSMSLSLMVEERLWGLVIFHHRAPHPVTIAVRRRLSELAGCLAARLALLEERAASAAREQGLARVNAIIGQIDLEQTFPENLIGKEPHLRQLVDADLVQFYHRGHPVFFAPECSLTAQQAAPLLAFLRTQPGPVWSSDCLSAQFEPAAVYPQQLAGVMAVFIDEAREEILLFGRRRVKYQVAWGADPTSLPFAEDDQTRPFGWPTRTFQTWYEERTHHARPWSAVELATGHALKDLIEQLLIVRAAHFEQLAQSLVQQREALRHRALHDSLTELPNREHFREALNAAIAECRRRDREIAVALLDIDHFKTINDTLGHDQGDALLCALAGRLGDELPEPALVARLGGDEFALLLPVAVTGGAPLARAAQLVEALREPIDLDGDRFSITVSLGLTVGGAEAEPGELLKQADLALYRAKEEGRNRACAFDAALATRALRQREIDRAVLERAPLEAIEILLQPQIAIAAEPDLPRFEVLARWRTDAGLLLMPGDFIPAAERNGLIGAVTTAVAQRALACLHAHLAGGGREVRLALNVSAADLESRRFVRQLIADLHRADLPPELIEIEITESLLLRLTPNVKHSLEWLDRAGIALVLDDFGTGFSSMAYLRELPIRQLKIDRAFVRGLEAAHDRRLVAGIIAMAHSIGKTVVAEGIETEQQLERLAAMDCDWGQGYFWSRPIAPEEAFARFG